MGGGGEVVVVGGMWEKRGEARGTCKCDCIYDNDEEKQHSNVINWKVFTSIIEMFQTLLIFWYWFG